MIKLIFINFLKNNKQSQVIVNQMQDFLKEKHQNLISKNLNILILLVDNPKLNRNKIQKYNLMNVLNALKPLKYYKLEINGIAPNVKYINQLKNN